jgi:hypothetical protein
LGTRLSKPSVHAGTELNLLEWYEAETARKAERAEMLAARRRRRRLPAAKELCAPFVET